MSQCIFNEYWAGVCKKDATVGDFCEKHSKKRCWCGAQATHDCGIASSLVCGAPLCPDHKCHYVGHGFTSQGPHSEEGQAQYKTWKEEHGNQSPGE